MWVANQLFSAVPGDAAKVIIGIGDDAFEIGGGHQLFMIGEGHFLIDERSGLIGHKTSTPVQMNNACCKWLMRHKTDPSVVKPLNVAGVLLIYRGEVTNQGIWG